MSQYRLYDSLFGNCMSIKSRYKAGGDFAIGKLTPHDIKANLMGGLPKLHGIWSGERGNSLWIPDADYVPQGKGIYAYNNMYEKTWRQILQENHCENGIAFVNGEIDFCGAEVVKAEVTLDDGIEMFFDEVNLSRGNRYYLHEAAFNRLSTIVGVPIEIAKRWKEEHLLVWHECCDLKTMQLVPREIHDNIPHQGGIALLKASRQ